MALRNLAAPMIKGLYWELLAYISANTESDVYSIILSLSSELNGVEELLTFLGAVSKAPVVAL